MAKELTESRRTQYTRHVLQDALIELMEEKPVSRITVRELCERADVNRSTFYDHYSNIDELLREIEDEAIDWLSAALEQLLQQPDTESIRQMVGRVCQYIVDNRSHLRVLMSSNADPRFQERLLRLIYNRKDIAIQIQPNHDSDPLMAEMRVHFIIAGSIGMIQHWLSTDLAASADSVAQIISDMALS